jgi:hypothetical protein
MVTFWFSQSFGAAREGIRDRRRTTQRLWASLIVNGSQRRQSPVWNRPL